MSKHFSKIRVWDLPTRVFHWLLVLSFSAAWLTNEESRYLHIHVFSGYTFGGLLVFRLLWGVVGSHYARFSQFAYSPRQVIDYLKTLFTAERQHYIGHNPAGSWGIYFLIAGGLLLAVSGVFLLGGQEQHGPLAGMLSFSQSRLVKELHELAANGLLLLVFVHIAGVIVESRLHKENLARAMVSGNKLADSSSPKVALHAIPALMVLALVMVGAWAMFGGYLSATKDKPYLPFKGPELVMNANWQESCGECHLAFHPSLLPARSWEKLLRDQDKHFGEDLVLDEESIVELTAYAKEQSSEHLASKTAWKINRLIPKSSLPLRITETKLWKHKHEEIDKEVWKNSAVKSKANCGACHFDAKLGTFEASGMKIPD